MAEPIYERVVLKLSGEAYQETWVMELISILYINS